MCKQDFKIVHRSATKWDKLWIDQAQRFSEESKDRSTRVGCVIVTPDNKLVSSGWNGFPRGVDDTIDERHNRPEKYNWAIHAELNAILNHAHTGGSSLVGCTAYLNYEITGICSGCMGCLRNAGIVRVIGPSTTFPGVADGQEDTYSSGPTQAIAAETDIEMIIVDYEPRRQ